MMTRFTTRNTCRLGDKRAIERGAARHSLRLAAILVFAVTLAAGRASAEDPVVAMRGNDQITLSEARALLAGTDAATRQKIVKDPLALKQALRDVLLQRAILHQAAAEKWSEKPEIAALLQKTRDQVIAQSFLAGHAALPAGYPAETDVQAAYDANKPRFMQPRSYHLAQIYLPLSAGISAEEARRRLLPARQALARGRADVQSAARGITGAQAMDLGWAPETQLLPAIKTAVQGLPEGGVSEVICIENGCHVIKLVATRPAGPAPLADVREQLVQALRRQKLAQEEASYESHLLEQQPVAINEIQLSHLLP